MKTQLTTKCEALLATTRYDCTSAVVEVLAATCSSSLRFLDLERSRQVTGRLSKSDSSKKTHVIFLNIFICIYKVASTDLTYKCTLRHFHFFCILIFKIYILPFSSIVFQVKDSSVAHLLALRQLASLSIFSTGLTEEGQVGGPGVERVVVPLSTLKKCY